MKETGCGCAGVFSAHAAIELYAGAFEQAGALDKLEALDLSYNQIGDPGMSALAGACASGALASCQRIYLDRNSASDAPVQQALAARKK